MVRLWAAANKVFPRRRLFFLLSPCAVADHQQHATSRISYIYITPCFLNRYNEQIGLLSALLHGYCFRIESPPAKDKYKKIIIEALRFWCKKEVVVYAFVIMPNHIYLLWRICKEHKREDLQRGCLEYTALRIR